MTPYVDPDMLPILEAMRAAPPIDYTAMPIEAARDVFEQGMAPWNALSPQNLLVEDLTIGGAAGPLRARLFRPDAEKLPLIVFVHGGGWTFGSVDSHQNEMRYLALKSGSTVLGFDYRRGPEAPFPAPLDDVLAVIEAVRAGILGDRADASRLALAGDSAGANLALIRRVAVSLLRRAPGKGSGVTKRLKAGWDDEYLLRVLQGITACIVR